MAGLGKELLGVAQHIWKELLPSIVLPGRDPGWQLLSLPQRVTPDQVHLFPWCPHFPGWGVETLEPLLTLAASPQSWQPMGTWCRVLSGARMEPLWAQHAR